MGCCGGLEKKAGHSHALSDSSTSGKNKSYSVPVSYGSSLSYSPSSASYTPSSYGSRQSRLY